MAEVTVQLIKELRQRTGAGMGDCRKALLETDGDIDEAVDFLRKSGLLKAAKRAHRATNEGKVSAVVSGNVAVLSEILCETDFVAKNQDFIAFCESLTEHVARAYEATGEITELVAQGEEARIAEIVTNVRENLQVRRVLRWAGEGQLASYVHLGGKIGVVVDVAGEADDEYLKNLCMHVAAFSPQYLTPEDVPEDVVAREREVYAALPEMASKPENVIDKILEGKVRKWYTEVCLLKQPWIWNQKSSVEKINPKAEIRRFVRWQVGEDL